MAEYLWDSRVFCGGGAGCGDTGRYGGGAGCVYTGGWGCGCYDGTPLSHWKCQYCDSMVKSKRMKCPNCGAPRKDEKYAKSAP